MLPRYPLRYFNAPSPVHREIGSAQHHTAVQEWLQHPGPLHCRMTDKAQHASHSMQQMGTRICGPQEPMQRLQGKKHHAAETKTLNGYSHLYQLQDGRKHRALAPTP